MGEDLLVFISTYFLGGNHILVKSSCIVPSLLFAACEFGLLYYNVLTLALSFFSCLTSRRVRLCFPLIAHVLVMSEFRLLGTFNV